MPHTTAHSDKFIFEKSHIQNIFFEKKIKEKKNPGDDDDNTTIQWLGYYHRRSKIITVIRDGVHSVNDKILFSVYCVTYRIIGSELHRDQLFSLRKTRLLTVGRRPSVW